LVWMDRLMQPIEMIALVGAGTMGSGVAMKAAQEGFNVQLIDRDQPSLDRGMDLIANTLAEAVERRILRSDEVEQTISRLSSVIGAENADVATDLVIEAVFEDLQVKQEVFNKIDGACAEHTVIATNTSSLSVDELARSVSRPDRFIGLHFFFHPAKNRLFEVSPATETSDDTLRRVVQFCKQMGKVVIVCKDQPGFVVNRFFVPWLNEAVLLLEEGQGSAEQIDAIACDAFHIALGPFGLMNLTGLPIALHSTDHLCEQLGTPRFKGAALLRRMVAAGNTWPLAVAAGGEGGRTNENESIIRERLLGAVFTIAAQIVKEGICEIEDVDRGAKVGLRWSKGPFELMNEVGIIEASRLARNYSTLAEKGLELPSLLAERNIPFEFSYVDVEMQGSIARVRINRPEVMNALNVELVAQLHQVVDRLEGDNQVTTMVFEGAGKAFIAGADVKFFVDKLRTDSFEEIFEFTRAGHDLLNKLEGSAKTTIALATGITMGGGLEFALACDYRIGSNKTQLQFPETGIGIYPGLGGTQRTPRMIGREMARWAILGRHRIDGQMAYYLGLIDELVSLGEVESTVLALAGRGKPDAKYSGAPEEITPRIGEIMRFYSDKGLPHVLSGRTPVGFDAEDELVVKQLKSISRAAPIALRMASELIDESARTNLEAGLQLELDRLPEIFGTDDALEGLSALIEARRPSYESR